MISPTFALPQAATHQTKSLTHLICDIPLRTLASDFEPREVESKVRQTSIQLYRKIESAANSVEEQTTFSPYRLNIAQERFPFEISFDVENKSKEDMPIGFFDSRNNELQPLEKNQIDLKDIEAQAARAKAFFVHFEKRIRDLGLEEQITITLKADSFLTRIGFYSKFKDIQILYRSLLEQPMFNEYGEKLIVTKASLNQAIYQWDRSSGYEGQWQKQNHYLIRLMALHEEGKNFEQIAAIMNEEFAWVDISKRSKWSPHAVKALIEERLDIIKREEAVGIKSTLVDRPLR